MLQYLICLSSKKLHKIQSLVLRKKQQVYHFSLKETEGVNLAHKAIMSEMLGLAAVWQSGFWLYLLPEKKLEK